jgi:hypothetical protein
MWQLQNVYLVASNKKKLKLYCMIHSLTMLIYAAATGYTEYYFDAQSGKVCRWEKCSIMMTHVLPLFDFNFE